MSVAPVTLIVYVLAVVMTSVFPPIGCHSSVVIHVTIRSAVHVIVTLLPLFNCVNGDIAMFIGDSFGLPLGCFLDFLRDVAFQFALRKSDNVQQARHRRVEVVRRCLLTVDSRKFEAAFLVRAVNSRRRFFHRRKLVCHTKSPLNHRKLSCCNCHRL